MKSVLVTDTHLGMANNDNLWIGVVEDLFNEIIDFCVKENIHTIIHLGDFFDSRKSLNVATLSKGIEICEKISKNNISLYIVRGNHDTYYKNLPTPHSLKQLSYIDNITVVDNKPLQLSDYILVPWAQDLSEIPDDSIVMGHFEINGFVINAHGHTHEGSTLNISDFNRFKSVYSGHFHTPSQNGNITYIGSAFPQDFNDVGSVRGYYVIEGNSLEFIEYTNSPKFVKLTSSDKFEGVENNIISFTFLEDFGNVENEKILKQLQEMGPAKLHIDYAIQIIDDEDIVTDEGPVEVRNNSEVMREYIDTKTFPKHIKKPVLKKMLGKIEGEINE